MIEKKRVKITDKGLSITCMFIDFVADFNGLNRRGTYLSYLSEGMPEEIEDNDDLQYLIDKKLVEAV